MGFLSQHIKLADHRKTELRQADGHGQVQLRFVLRRTVG